MLLAEADSNNHHMLIRNDVSTLAQDEAPASLVLGRNVMTTATSGSSTAQMQTPYGVFGNGAALFVADSGNHRVLVHPEMPTQSGVAAGLTLGQAPAGAPGGCGDAVSSAQSLSIPYGIGWSGSTLIVGSSDESRYVLYPSEA